MCQNEVARISTYLVHGRYARGILYDAAVQRIMLATTRTLLLRALVRAPGETQLEKKGMLRTTRAAGVLAARRDTRTATVGQKCEICVNICPISNFDGVCLDA